MPHTSMRDAETLDVLVALFTEHGFLALSVQDMARLSRRSKSTLYGVAPTKEGIIEAVVREFFRRATAQAESSTEGESPEERLRSYLSAIATVLKPVEGRFVTDMAKFGPARAIYLANIRMAAARVQQFAAAALPADSTVDPKFVGFVSGLVMEAVHRGDFQAAMDLTAADAYSALAELLSAGMKPKTDRQESDRT